MNPATWAKDLLSGDYCSIDDAAKVICGIWSLWTGRNARRHGREDWSPIAAARHIASMLDELVCLNAKPNQRQQPQHGCWARPPNGWAKVNADAAFVESQGNGTGGAIIRDAQGTVLAASAQFYEHLPDAGTAEAIAARCQ